MSSQMINQWFSIVCYFFWNTIYVIILFNSFSMLPLVLGILTQVLVPIWTLFQVLWLHRTVLCIEEGSRSYAHRMLSSYSHGGIWPCSYFAHRIHGDSTRWGIRSMHTCIRQHCSEVQSTYFTCNLLAK